MNIENQVNDLFEQIDQEFNDQGCYGLQFVLDDLAEEFGVQHHEPPATDWYGLTDLTLE